MPDRMHGQSAMLFIDNAFANRKNHARFYLGHVSAGESPTCLADSSVTPTFTSSYNRTTVATKPLCKQVFSTHMLP